VMIEDLPFVAAAVRKHSEYIASQTLALEVSLASADQLIVRAAGASRGVSTVSGTPGTSDTSAAPREIDIEEQMVKVVVEKV